MVAVTNRLRGIFPPAVDASHVSLMVALHQPSSSPGSWLLTGNWNLHSHRTQSSPFQDAAKPTRESLVCCSGASRIPPFTPSAPALWQRFSWSLHLTPICKSEWNQTWHSSVPQAANPRQRKVAAQDAGAHAETYDQHGGLSGWEGLRNQQVDCR